MQKMEEILALSHISEMPIIEQLNCSEDNKVLTLS